MTEEGVERLHLLFFQFSFFHFLYFLKARTELSRPRKGGTGSNLMIISSVFLLKNRFRNMHQTQNITPTLTVALL